MNLLEAKDLTKTYKDKTAVNHINLTVKSGQLIAFLGPNGAGKSTTINMLTGIIEPTSGSIEINKMKPSNNKYKRDIGVVFQNSVLDNQLTVQENIMMRASMYESVTSDKYNYLMKEFDLESIANQKYGELSGGQRRRVDIARALVHSPELLFLDEPSTGLDIQTRNVIWETLNKLRQEQGLTIILTTHYLEEAEEADYVYVIDHGQIIAEDTVNGLKNKYANNLLTIVSDNLETVIAQINPDWNITKQDQQIVVAVPDENQAIELLTAIKSQVQHFEFRQGNMDDIFVALTGKEIR